MELLKLLQHLFSFVITYCNRYIVVAFVVAFSRQSKTVTIIVNIFYLHTTPPSDVWYLIKNAECVLSQPE